MADDVVIRAASPSVGCGPSTGPENCPKNSGPDYDFGSSPILKTLPNGSRILVAGQKSGMIWAHDPDQKGALVWKTQLPEKLALGEITFGGAADDQRPSQGKGVLELALPKEIHGLLDVPLEIDQVLGVV